MSNHDKNHDGYTYEWQRQEAMNRHPSGQNLPPASSPPSFQGPPVPPKKKHTGLKWTGGILGAFILFAACGSIVSDSDDTSKPAATVTESATPTTTPAPTPEAVKEEPTAAEPTAEPEPTKEPKATPEPTKQEEEPAVEMTAGQSNAVQSADDYLSFMAFSRSGLIDQLKFEGYETADAKFAVDYLDVNWDKQAAASAKEYLDSAAFSRVGLIEQLKFEGFTPEQATYGVDQTDL